MILSKIDSEFLRYLLADGHLPGERLPSLTELSTATGMSMGKLREQFEVARTLGLVEASPRRGITRTEYSFLPAVRLSLLTALAIDGSYFDAFSGLRVHLETAYWDEAVALLIDEDFATLRSSGSGGLAEVESAAHPDSVPGAPRAAPDDLSPARQPVCRGPAGSVLGRVRGGGAEHLRRLQLSASGVALPRAHRGGDLRRGRWRKASDCWSSTCSCSTRGASPWKCRCAPTARHCRRP